MTTSLAPARPAPDSRAWQIITLIARRGPLTVAQLVGALGVTTTAVRQQVNRLLWQGWLLREQRRCGRGRPADLFGLSEQARGMFASGVEQFARLLIEEIGRREGEQRRREIVGGVWQRIAGEMERLVGGGAPRQRVARLAELLRQRGMVIELAEGIGGVRLRVFTCPYHGLAAARRDICELERDALARLAGGAAQLERCAVDGQTCCEFNLSLEAEGVAAG